jgi:hypothetical protein
VDQVDRNFKDVLRKHTKDGLVVITKETERNESLLVYDVGDKEISAYDSRGKHVKFEYKKLSVSFSVFGKLYS